MKVNYQRLRNALRRFWMLYWPARSEALEKAKVPYKGDNPRRKYSWVCAVCNKENSSSEVAVDHVIACGELLGPEDHHRFINNLFFGELQILCKYPCHALKTALEKKLAAKKRAERKRGE